MLDVRLRQQSLRVRVVRLRVDGGHPVHRRGELGEELGLLHRLRVDSHDCDLAVLVKGAVARRAVAHPPAEVDVLSLEGGRPPHGAGGEDERLRLDGQVGRVDCLGVSVRLDEEDLRTASDCAVLDGLVAHPLEQRGAAHLRVLDARVVCDVRRDGERARGGVLVEHHRLEVRARRVERARAARRPAAHDHHVALDLAAPRWW
mmetsp:Transcript_16343/g.48528  ORF Transcript_16343/g.48528 Transcript_16343/m.48528 type:complete len:203 (+) Transcript_16343:636-1244(+)